MQRRLDPETYVIKPVENVSSHKRIHTFFREEAPIFVTFSSVFLFGRVNFRHLRYLKTTLEGSRGMLPQNIFENLHTAMAVLMLSEQLLRKVCHIFGP